MPVYLSQNNSQFVS